MGSKPATNTDINAFTSRNTSTPTQRYPVERCAQIAPALFAAALADNAGTTYFALVIVAMHFIRPDINPIERPTSEYAVGPFGYLMTCAFLVAATFPIDP